MCGSCVAGHMWGKCGSRVGQYSSIDALPPMVIKDFFLKSEACEKIQNSCLQRLIALCVSIANVGTTQHVALVTVSSRRHAPLGHSLGHGPGIRLPKKTFHSKVLVYNKQIINVCINTCTGVNGVHNNRCYS